MLFTISFLVFWGGRTLDFILFFSILMGRSTNRETNFLGLLGHVGLSLIYIYMSVMKYLQMNVNISLLLKIFHLVYLDI